MLKIEDAKEGIFVFIKVIAGASETKVRDIKDGILKIAVQERPEKNKANDALLLFLSKQLKVPCSSLRLISGRTSSLKKIFCPVSREKFISVFKKN